MTRQAELLELDAMPTQQHVLARAQCFTVERVAGEPFTKASFASTTEIIVLLPSAGATISGDASGAVQGHAVVILAAGSYALELAAKGEAYILATDRRDHGEPVNAVTYAAADGRVKPVGEPYRMTKALDAIRCYPIEDIPIPPDNGRLRFIQSATMSLNWVEYRGQRGRDALSPHSHTDFEQASLAIEGEFIHHLRTPWGRDADLWRDDVHLAAGPRSLVVIPPEIIHTTEGVGDGLHVLVDIFAPPRRDFIARNWICNAGDYQEPAVAVAVPHG